MIELKLNPAIEPTFYYIGVTTGKSSIMRVFPKWAEYLGIGGSRFVGIDCKIHDDPKTYQKIVQFIKNDKLSLGALVTSHKIDLFEAAEEFFDGIDHYAELLKETSCISKQGEKLWAHAKDPITSGLAYEAFVPKGYWKKYSGDLCLIGAGGATLALTCYLMENLDRDDWPTKIYITNRSLARLDHMKQIHAKINPGIEMEYLYCPKIEDNDHVVNNLNPYSVVVNGTGLGKDYPGSPITDDAIFPEHGMAWDYNYRGDLYFLEQARRHQKERDLHIEDGWIYFLHGWTRVIAEVFHIDIPIKGPKFEEISKIASEVR